MRLSTVRSRHRTLRKGAVTAKKLRNNAVKAPKIRKGAITTGKLRNSAVRRSKIGKGR